MLTKIKSRDILISILITLTLTLLGIYISSIVVDEDKNKSEFYYYSNSKIFIDPATANTIELNHIVYELNKALSMRSMNFDDKDYIIKLEGISEKEIDAKLIEVSKIIKQINIALINKLQHHYEYIQNSYSKFLNKLDVIIESQEEMFSKYDDTEVGLIERLEMNDKYYERSNLILQKELKYKELNFLIELMKNDPNYEIVTLGKKQINSIPVNYFNSSKLIIIFLFFIIGIFISWLILEFKSFFRVRK